MLCLCVFVCVCVGELFLLLFLVSSICAQISLPARATAEAVTATAAESTKRGKKREQQHLALLPVFVGFFLCRQHTQKLNTAGKCFCVCTSLSLPLSPSLSLSLYDLRAEFVVL